MKILGEVPLLVSFIPSRVDLNRMYEGNAAQGGNSFETGPQSPILLFERLVGTRFPAPV